MAARRITTHWEVFAGTALMDARARAESRHHEVKLSLTNVFDTRYYESRYENGGFTVPGTGRPATTGGRVEVLSLRAPVPAGFFPRRSLAAYGTIRRDCRARHCPAGAFIAV